MKNIRILFICYLLLFSIQDINASIGNDSVKQSAFEVNTLNTVKSDYLISSGSEINNMDRATLTNSQKKVSRKQAQAIKKEQVHGGGGIYLSLSAIVIVMLLLIILL